MAISGHGGSVDGQLGEAGVLVALDQREVMVYVDLDHVSMQCLGQFPLLGRTHQPVAGRDERDRGQAQLTRPGLSVITAQRAARIREFAC